LLVDDEFHRKEEVASVPLAVDSDSATGRRGKALAPPRPSAL